MGAEAFSQIISLTIIIVALSTVVIVAIVNYKRKQEYFIKERKIMSQEFEKQIMQAKIEVQEATSSALSKELHDNIGQLLSTTKMLIAITERNLPSIPDTLITANHTLGKAIVELRALSKSLDKDWLSQFDFDENLISEINRLNSSEVITAKYIGSEKIHIDSEKQIILFRLVQEAIHNAIKHGDPKKIEVSVKQEKDMLLIKISDDGCGFVIEDYLNGMGLINIKHRTKILNGQVTWKSSRGQGTIVEILIPNT